MFRLVWAPKLPSKQKKLVLLGTWHQSAVCINAEVSSNASMECAKRFFFYKKKDLFRQLGQTMIIIMPTPAYEIFQMVEHGTTIDSGSVYLGTKSMAALQSIGE